MDPCVVLSIDLMSQGRAYYLTCVFLNIFFLYLKETRMNLSVKWSRLNDNKDYLINSGVSQFEQLYVNRQNSIYKYY